MWFRGLKVIQLFLLILLLISPGVAISTENSMDVAFVSSIAAIAVDTSVQNAGYFVNEKPQATWVPVSTAGDTIIIRLSSIPSGMLLKTVVDDGEVRELIGHPVTITVAPHTEPLSIQIHLSLIKDPNAPPVNPFPGFIPSVTPGTPDTPVNPDTPDTPDTPVNPDTPDTPDTPSTPGTDEPYIPILPPAGSVYNFAGFIPIGAGALLLFLAFFWKRKVYRILKSHAKKHGEKPEKEHLKEIADAIIKLVRDDGRYPEWKKNSDVAKRLSADIVSVLDEMNYARAVPRGALVAEIIKAAKGRINRHRL